MNDSFLFTSLCQLSKQQIVGNKMERPDYVEANK